MMSRFFYPKGLVSISFLKNSVEASQRSRKLDRPGSLVYLLSKDMTLEKLII